ncbi:LysR family transcriptional regulator [Paraburkholderia sp. Ac-20342]|uniref:LysR family transcriptional regulator n=1 Tax=Paraburkholderia sp. Ac-20342 TaxID=2703889 RepID=UPI00197F9460|nr:LysR family transcriptional regulator [Paraburkholderia sp. Ac-20342]MBN3846293.1 LysR family transcriptional regulator [Paraburkholderia sp. Ac-20342]
MELRQIKAFATVATLGSFRVAANQLHITQPAVSLRVASLEEEIGAKLFNRDGAGVTLTPRGVEFLELAQRLLETASQMTRRGTVSASLPRIRIGVTPMIVSAWLTEILRMIQDQLADRTFELVVDTSRRLRPCLVEGKLDAVIMTGPSYTSGVRNIPLISYGSEWIVSRRLNVPDFMSLAEIAKFPLISYATDSGTYGDIEYAFREQEVWPVHLNCANSGEAILRFVEAGMGIGVINAGCLIGGVYSELLKIIKTDVELPRYEYFASYHLESGSDVGMIISDIAREVCRNLQRDNSGAARAETKEANGYAFSQAMFMRNVIK